MITDAELLDALGLRSDHRAVLEAMVEARGVSIANQLNSWLYPILAPWANNRVHDQYHAMVKSHRDERRTNPIQVTFINGKKYDQYRNRLCDVANCFKRHVAKGLCMNHRDEANRNYVAILPIAVNPKGLRFDADGVQICKACDRKATYKSAGFCHADYQAERLNRPTQV